MRQHAPRMVTIAVAAVIVLVGVAGTFLELLPSVAGVSGEMIGVAAYVLATAVLLAGSFIRGL
jgi:hypothetical protein